MRAGIFGGTFNPIHLGHLIGAETARERLGLSRVIFVPTGQPPHKSPGELAPAEHRREMTWRAVAGNAAFEVSDVEVFRAGVCYSIDTVRALRASLPAGAELFFIIGADTVAELATWREIGRLAELCEFVPLPRPGVAVGGGASGGRLEALARLIGAERVRRICNSLLDMPLIGISSSAVRARVREGRSVRYLVPHVVEEYVREHRLYR